MAMARQGQIDARPAAQLRDPQAAWLKDLVVFEGYHERLLAAAEAMLSGADELELADATNPDVSFRAYLRWCAAQPATPQETWKAWRSGRFTVRGGLASGSGAR